MNLSREYFVSYIRRNNIKRLQPFILMLFSFYVCVAIVACLLIESIRHTSLLKKDGILFYLELLNIFQTMILYRPCLSCTEYIRSVSKFWMCFLCDSISSCKPFYDYNRLLFHFYTLRCFLKLSVSSISTPTPRVSVHFLCRCHLERFMIWADNCWLDLSD